MTAVSAVRFLNNSQRARTLINYERAAIARSTRVLFDRAQPSVCIAAMTTHDDPAADDHQDNH